MSANSERPIPFEGKPAPEGFHYEAFDQRKQGWVTPAVGAGRCRFGASGRNHACGNPAAATLFRTTFQGSTWVGRPWDYCSDPEHLYGRWIENGKVMGWRLVKDAD